MSISSEDFADVYGYQFTMNLNGLSYAGVNAGAIAMNDSNVGVLASDKVTMSWNTSEAVTAAAGSELFAVTFVAERSGRLSEMVAITSEVTVAEAYAGANMSVNGINLNLGNTTAVAAEYALGQNEPNPFKGTTVISYTLPQAANAVITVFDVTGKVVIENKVSADAGVNTIAIQERDLNGSGVYYYQLRSGDYTATKKMIIIE